MNFFSKFFALCWANLYVGRTQVMYCIGSPAYLYSQVIPKRWRWFKITLALSLTKCLLVVQKYEGMHTERLKSGVITVHCLENILPFPPLWESSGYAPVLVTIETKIMDEGMNIRISTISCTIKIHILFGQDVQFQTWHFLKRKITMESSLP